MLHVGQLLLGDCPLDPKIAISARVIDLGQHHVLVKFDFIPRALSTTKNRGESR